GERAVAAKHRRHVRGAELLRHRRFRRDDPADGMAQLLRALQGGDERGVVRQPVAAAEHRRAGGGDGAAQQVATIAPLGAHQGVGLRAHDATSSFAGSSGTRYQPVIIERISFQTPAITTSTTWTTTKITRPSAARKCSE